MLASLQTLKLKKGFFHVLDGGLLRRKARNNVIILWDVLVHENQYLLGTTYRERFALLKTIMNRPLHKEFLHSLWVGTSKSRDLWLAPVLKGDFRSIFEAAIKLPEIEGLVFKDMNAELKRAFHPERNSAWQIRVRKPSKNYRF